MSYLKREAINREIGQSVIEKHHITRKKDGLEYIELKLLSFETGGEYLEKLTDLEVCVVVLEGRVSVYSKDNEYKNIGTRSKLFEKIPTDSVYFSSGKIFKIVAEEEAKVVFCYAPSDKELPTRLIRAKDNQVEYRGRYQNKRMVHNILDDQNNISDKLIVVEVYTDGGNWSSYPPHKHDENNLPKESFLEETYYHELNPKQGFVFQRVYTEDRQIDETMAVENENVVLVPKGYHPVSVPDGYDSYYLNIMAGPIKKWKFHNDKAHEWLIDRV